jgi:hypothetical protein
MATVKAIQIDSVNKTVKVVDHDTSHYSNIYPFLSVSKESPCSCFTLANMGNVVNETITELSEKLFDKFEGMDIDIAMFVDDEGLFNDEAKQNSFCLAQTYQPYAGNALIVFTTIDNDGDEHYQSFDDESLKTLIDCITNNIKFGTAYQLR